MKVNLAVKTLKKCLCLFLTAILTLSVCPAAYAEDTSDYEDIQILKGDLYTIETKGLQRVSISDPSIADIVDTKQAEVIISGQQPGQTVLFLWDENGKHSFFVRVMSEDLGLIRERVRTILIRSGITGVNVERNDLEGKVILSGNVPEDKIEIVAAASDFFPGLVLNLVKKEEIDDMIQIDMQITELSTTLSKAMGVEWFTAGVGGDSSGAFTPGFLETIPTTTGKIQDIFSIGDINRVGPIIARINMLLAEGKATVLSKPRLTVKSGKEATLQVGGEIPIASVTSDTAGNKVTQNTTFKPYGVSMGITPTLMKGRIDIVLNTEISDIDASNSQVGKDFAYLTRSAQTQLFLDDKQTIVLAGMIKKNHSKQKSKLPFFGSIPIIGALFRNTASPAEKETEVVISLTATIIKTGKKAPVSEVDLSALKDRTSSLNGEDQMVIASDRSNNKLPIISMNAASLPVRISKNLKPYAESVQLRISSSIAFPYQARDNRWQGTVKLALVIRKDGSLRDVFVKESSGYDVFDRDAVNTARTLAPYNHFPEGIGQDEITITIPIVYSLEAMLKEVVKPEKT